MTGWEEGGGKKEERGGRTEEEGGKPSLSHAYFTIFFMLQVFFIQYISITRFCSPSSFQILPTHLTPCPFWFYLFKQIKANKQKQKHTHNIISSQKHRKCKPKYTSKRSIKQNTLKQSKRRQKVYQKPEFILC